MTSLSCLFSPRVLARTAFITAVLCISLLPFSAALEIHHAFAEVDHDGHEHSEFDLCQWIQQHTSGALSIDPLNVATPFSSPDRYHRLIECEWTSLTISVGGSRAPPLS